MHGGIVAQSSQRGKDHIISCIKPDLETQPGKGKFKFVLDVQKKRFIQIDFM